MIPTALHDDDGSWLTGNAIDIVQPEPSIEFVWMSRRGKERTISMRRLLLAVRVGIAAAVVNVVAFAGWTIAAAS